MSSFPARRGPMSSGSLWKDNPSFPCGPHPSLAGAFPILLDPVPRGAFQLPQALVTPEGG